ASPADRTVVNGDPAGDSGGTARLRGGRRSRPPPHGSHPLPNGAPGGPTPNSTRIRRSLTKETAISGGDIYADPDHHARGGRSNRGRAERGGVFEFIFQRKRGGDQCARFRVEPGRVGFGRVGFGRGRRSAEDRAGQRSHRARQRQRFHLVFVRS